MTAAAPALPPLAGAPSASSDAAAHSRSQWQLIARRYARHRLAVVCLRVLGILYLVAALAEFFAPYPAMWRDLDHAFCPPQPPRFSPRHGLHVYAVKRHVDPITYKKSYIEDPRDIVPLGFFVKGEPYKLLGLVPGERHFFGVNHAAYRPAEGNAMTPTFYLLGADQYGQDLFSRIVYGARVSLSIGLVSIFMTFVLGLAIGGLSGYVGGRTDTAIQRLIEIVNSFPHLPLWLALAAAMPSEWSSLQTYFAITLVLALLSWTGLARVVRGKILALREEDYAVAARLMGAGHARVLFLHLLPGFTSHIIVSLTLSVPGMILGETALSFLGLGLRPPVVSWGVMIQDCKNMEVLANYPWLLLPVIVIVLTVLCFNFIGDGLRDAADPYSAR
jgi:peptide/nickel transport system permease protein